MTEYGFMVCDKCGYIWDEGEQLEVCPKCQHDAVWRFAKVRKAVDHSNMIRHGLEKAKNLG
jgi:predicted RNA-binding Zn-ribbon protein involved in translation (DUF1610 family)